MYRHIHLVFFLIVVTSVLFSGGFTYADVLSSDIELCNEIARQETREAQRPRAELLRRLGIEGRNSVKIIKQRAKINQFEQTHGSFSLLGSKEWYAIGRMKEKLYRLGSNYKQEEKKRALAKEITLITAMQQRRDACVLTAREKGGAIDHGMDLGDAPDSDPYWCRQQYTIPPFCRWHYPKLEINHGVRHMNVSVAWLGRSVSSEFSARGTNEDTEDDFLGDYEIHNAKWDSALFVNVLIDYNNDGDWEDPGEWVVQNSSYMIPKGKTQKISVMGPPPGLWYRITLTGRSISNYNGRGVFSIGETEDYLLGSAINPSPKNDMSLPFLPEEGGGGGHPGGGKPGGEGGAPGEGGKGGGGKTDGGGNPFPHHLLIETEGRAVYSVCKPKRLSPFSTGCENCKQKQFKACYTNRCMATVGDRYDQLNAKKKDALGKANWLVATSGKQQGVMKGDKPTSPIPNWEHVWQNHANTVKTSTRAMKRLVGEWSKQKGNAENQCLIQAKDGCRSECSTDDGRYKTPWDDVQLQQCGNQPARCTNPWQDMWGKAPEVGHELGDWNKATRTHMFNAGRLKDYLIARAERKLHPAAIILDQSASSNEKKTLSFHYVFKRGESRIFTEDCNKVTVTPQYRTTWTQIEHWNHYNVSFEVPLFLDLGGATVKGFAQLAKKLKIPGIGKAMDFMERIEKAELDSDLASAVQDSLTGIIHDEVEAYIDGKKASIKKNIHKRLDKLKGQVQKHLENTQLTKRQRESLLRVKGMISQAYKTSEDIESTLKKIKKLGKLPELARQRAKSIQKEAGLCSDKYQTDIAARVKTIVNSSLKQQLEKSGGHVKITDIKFKGNGWSTGCTLSVSAKAFLPIRLCDEATQCDIVWDKDVSRGNCSEDPVDSDCPDCGIDVIQVIPHTGNNPFDPINLVDGGDTTGGFIATPPTVIAPPPVVTPPAIVTPPPPVVISPVVKAPAEIFLNIGTGQPVPKAWPQISQFLASATATDNTGVSIATVNNNAPALFPITPLALVQNGLPYGARTVITFSATDQAGRTGTATSAVSIYTTGAPQYRTGTCPLPVVTVPLGTNLITYTVSINDPAIQTYITCMKNAFVDTVGRSVIPVSAASVSLFGGATDQAVGRLDYQLGVLPAPPSVYPVNRVITNRLRFKAVDANKNVGTASLSFIGIR